MSSSPRPRDPAIVSAELGKAFGARQVLDHATLVVARHTVHALVGENGAGKSTLVKLVAGVLGGGTGSLVYDGTSIDLATWDRRLARRVGIGIVQQHGASAGTLSVVENAVLGAEPMRGPLLAIDDTAAALRTRGRALGWEIDPYARAGKLSLGQAQRAEIVAALYHGAQLLILDEPTAVLTPREVDELVATLRRLRRETSIVIVTHKLDEVQAVADAVTVLRDGKTVATWDRVPATDGVAEASAAWPPLDLAAIARAMVGADVPAAPPATSPAGDARPALELVGLARGAVEVSLEVREGELVGVAGVDGNGQRELALAIAGLARAGGRVRIAGRDVSSSPPAQRLAAGLAYIPEDRHHGGLVLDSTVAENLALGRHDITGRFVIDRAAVARHARERIAELDIRPPDAAAIVRSLSGGNQQKVVIGRELSRPNLRAVIASQPTRGVDLGAVAKIHDRLRAAAAAGAGVLVISADLDELLALCHRIVVLLRGRIVGERAGEALRAAGARAALGALMTGAEDAA